MVWRLFVLSLGLGVVRMVDWDCSNGLERLCARILFLDWQVEEWCFYELLDLRLFLFRFQYR